MENNNKLIAEFMEFKLQADPKERWFGQYFTTPNEAWSNRIELLLFDTDWNWLMPVVEKILDISLELDTMEPYYNITDSIPNIKETYKEVVEFINWYNKKK